MCCRGVQGAANAAYLGDFLCSGLLRVAVLRSRWYQNGVNIALGSTFD
jgi:hypothetical protein